MDAIEQGVYVAHHGNNNEFIAMDEYVIMQTPSGFLVQSNNIVFGTNGFQQRAVLQTDIHWQMQKLQVASEALNVEMCASINDNKLYLQQKQPEVNFEKIIDLQIDKYFFMYQGALVIPMIWLRGFDFENYEKVTYQMLPAGYAEIKQLSDVVSDNKVRTFSLLMYLQNFTDIVTIETDISGKLLSLHSETNNVIIKIKSM